MPPNDRAPITLEDRFWGFHRAHPEVYRALRTMALSMRRRGVARYSMKGLFEVLRWRATFQTGAAPFKLNNIYTALYARLLMEREQELQGFFETRERQTA